MAPSVSSLTLSIINAHFLPLPMLPWSQLIHRVFPSHRHGHSLTLDSRLGTGGGDGTHGSDHEVSEEGVPVQRVLGHVVAEVGDLVGLGFTLEGALESRARTITENRGGADCTGAGEAGGRSNGRLRKGARSSCERCHRTVVVRSIGVELKRSKIGCRRLRSFFTRPSF